MTDRRTDGQTDRRTDRRTDGGDCNIPDAFLKKRGDKNDQDVVQTRPMTTLTICQWCCQSKTIIVCIH